MKSDSILKNEYFKNFLFLILFLFISFSIGLLKKSSITEKSDFSKVQILANENKLLKKSAPTVLYFWATWCSVCKANFYIIDWNYKLSQFMDINFISVEEGENLDLLKSIIHDRFLPYPVGISNDLITKQFYISEYPTFVFLDRENSVKIKDSGIVNPLSYFLRLLYIKYF